MKMNILSLTLTFSVKRQENTIGKQLHEQHMKHVREELLDKMARNLH